MIKVGWFCQYRLRNNLGSFKGQREWLSKKRQTAPICVCKNRLLCLLKKVGFL
jgi:hypothetical protein